MVLLFDQFSDEESPLYEFSARDISSKMQFEIILTMEGITPETGNTIQVGRKMFFFKKTTEENSWEIITPETGKTIHVGRARHFLSKTA